MLIYANNWKKKKKKEKKKKRKTKSIDKFAILEKRSIK
jgi:hypothetical protein